MVLGTIGIIIVGIIVLAVIIAIVVFLVEVLAPIFVGLTILAIIVGVGLWIYSRIKRALANNRHKLYYLQIIDCDVEYNEILLVLDLSSCS